MVVQLLNKIYSVLFYSILQYNMLCRNYWAGYIWADLEERGSGLDTGFSPASGFLDPISRILKPQESDVLPFDPSTQISQVKPVTVERLQNSRNWANSRV